MGTSAAASAPATPANSCRNVTTDRRLRMPIAMMVDSTTRADT
jgi:hypothetical protein